MIMNDENEFTAKEELEYDGKSPEEIFIGPT